MPDCQCFLPNSKYYYKILDDPIRIKHGFQMLQKDMYGVVVTHHVSNNEESFAIKLVLASRAIGP